jgi:hypothetical protein
MPVFTSELDHRVWLASRSRIAEANRLERTESKSLSPAIGRNLNGHAPLEIRNLVELVSVKLIRPSSVRR